MKRWLWPGEVARELGVCAKTVNRWADAGAVEVVRDAMGRRHFKPEAVQILAAHLGLALSSIHCRQRTHGSEPYDDTATPHPDPQRR